MFYNYENCPCEIKEQLNRLVNMCRSCLKESLTGVYLHGSLAMGCFNPKRSDLDIIVVTDKGILSGERMEIIRELVNISLDPSPNEISFLVEEKLKNGGIPFYYELHYSEDWREKYKREITNPEAGVWNDEWQRDMDLSAHIRVINERGITLFGKDKDELFPRVKDGDYLAAILYDFDDARDGYKEKPVYFILNICRVLNFLECAQVTSKKEGGEWALKALPGEFNGIIQNALSVYRDGESGENFDFKEIEKFITYSEEIISRNKNRYL